MKKKWAWFSNQSIKAKLLIVNIGIIIIMMLSGGIANSVLSRNILSEASLKSSKILTEQLSGNLGNSAERMEEFILKEVFESNLNQAMNPKGIDPSNRRIIRDFAYGLINYNKYIKIVLIQDNAGNCYENARNDISLTKEEFEECVAFEKVEKLWGKVQWIPYNGEMVFASRLIFDKNTMEKLGVVSVGIDTQYVKMLYQNLIREGENEIVILNCDNQILVNLGEEMTERVEILAENYDLSQNSEIEFQHEDTQYITTIWNTNKKNIRIMNLIDKRVISDSVQKMLRPLWYSAALAIIISIVLAVLISRDISKNIKLLLYKSRSMEKGDFYTEIQPVNYDEIGMLALEFNEMSKKIQQLLDKISEEKIQKQKAELKAVQFEYDALQAKINPHFLYNTLESINSLAKIREDYEVADSICLLGDYLRETISEKKKFVSLEEELENIRKYIKIQQISYADRVKMEIFSDEMLSEALVPKLILQPLIENAIVHGIEPKLGKGLIRVEARCVKKTMEIAIWDNGVGINPKQIKDGRFVENMSKGVGENENHTKVGITAVHKRIQILYGETYGIFVTGSRGNGTCVVIRLPIIFEGEEE